MIKKYRILVDGQYYFGESEISINVHTSDAWSNNSFQTTRVNKSTLCFSSKDFLVIEGYTNLLSHLKKVINFIRDENLMAGNKIEIESEPFAIPLELDLDKILAREDELEILNSQLKQQLNIATDLGQKRFEENYRFRVALKRLSNCEQLSEYCASIAKNALGNINQFEPVTKWNDAKKWTPVLDGQYIVTGLLHGEKSVFQCEYKKGFGWNAEHKIIAYTKLPTPYEEVMG